MTNRREREEFALTPLDNRALANLCGPLDANLRQIEAALDVAIAHRGGTFTVSGAPTQTRLAAEVLRRFYALAEKPLSVDDIQLGLIELTTQSAGPPGRRRRRRRHAAAHAARRPARTHAEPGALPEAHPGARHHVRASARPEPARPIWRSRAPSTRSSATR
jgi:phosphate starvation-inducible protein PhoH